MADKRIDVYSYGMVSSSTLYTIGGEFPAAEGYAEIDAARHMTGGEAANSSIVLSRLGARVMLDGNWFGDDDGSKRTKAILNDRLIDTSRLPLKQGIAGAAEVVFAAGGSRTVFGNYGRLLENGRWNMPCESDIEAAKVVCLDPFFGDASRRAAEIAFRSGTPVVTVDCRHDDPLLSHVAAVVVAEAYINENYAEQKPEELFREYQAHCNGLVIFTFGDKALWYAGPGEAAKRFQAFAIEPVDTTGGGDSFRAGIVFGFLKEWDADRTIEFAAALAALNCTRVPGVLDSPTKDEVIDFLRERNA